jgi:hypothetical protein
MSDAVDCYDPATAAWTAVTRLPVPLAEGFLAATDDMLLVAGGAIGYQPDDRDDPRTSLCVYQYRFECGAWEVLTQFPFPYASCCLPVTFVSLPHSLLP